MSQYINIQGKFFHHSWLRENCPYCRYPSPYQQLYSSTISGDTKAKPAKVQIDGDNLIIAWDEQPTHTSTYKIPDLLKQASAQNQQQKSNKVYWNEEILNKSFIPAYSIKSGKINDDSWLSTLDKFGFILLRNTPAQDIKSFFGKIAILSQQYFGDTFNLNEQKEDAKKNNSSENKGGCYLPPHNDLTFWGDHKLLQFFYCEKNSHSGGDSILVDGFYVAEKMKKKFPEYFKLLCNTKVEFSLIDPNHEYIFKHLSTILEYGENGKIESIRFSKRNCRPYFMDQEKATAFYEAYQTIFSHLKKEENQFFYHLKPEDCIVFQNFRLLHGRTAFDVSPRGRKIHSGYYDWKYFEARLNYLDYVKN